MQIKKYGICLESLSLTDLELLRNWRNSDLVRPFMHFQEFIHPEMQHQWFNGIDPSENLYFIISKDQIKIGLIHLKDIDWLSCGAEAGIFIGDLEYMNSIVPVLATICLMDLAFEVLSLKILKAKIEKANQRTLQFNLNLGYKLANEISSEKFQYYLTDILSFHAATAKLRPTLNKLNIGGYVISMNQFEKNNYLRLANPSLISGLDLKISD